MKLKPTLQYKKDLISSSKSLKLTSKKIKIAYYKFKQTFCPMYFYRKLKISYNKYHFKSELPIKMVNLNAPIKLFYFDPEFLFLTNYLKNTFYISIKDQYNLLPLYIKNRYKNLFKLIKAYILDKEAYKSIKTKYTFEFKDCKSWE